MANHRARSACYQQGDANTIQNDLATLASDDNDTLDLDIAHLQRDDLVLSKIIEVSQPKPSRQLLLRREWYSLPCFRTH